MEHVILFAVLVLCLFSGTAVCRSLNDHECDFADVALVMDASSSIGPSNLERLKTFLQGLVGKFDIGEDRVNVALVKYNRFGEKVFSLNEYKSQKEVNDAIAAVNGTDFGTRTGHALKVVGSEVFVEKNGDRPDAPNVVLLVTDGRSTFPEWTFKEAQLLKDAGVTIFAIGIGGRIDADELRQTASSPDSVYVHYVNDFHGLDEIQNEFAKIFCEDLTTPPPPPSTTTPEDLECYFADVALVMDASSSIGPSNLERLKTFLQKLVGKFTIAEDWVNVALVKYNKFGQKVFSLNQYHSQTDINDAIAAVNGTAVGTRTGHALKVVRNDVFAEKNGDRPDAPNVVLLVTDGRSTYPEWTFEQAQLLKDAGVSIFAIGIGGRIDADELRQTASSPDSMYVHYVNDFHGLDEILNAFAKIFCEDLTTPPPPPPTTTTPEVCALGDVALVMDASSSIGPSNLERLKTFLQNLVENFDIGEDRVNVALVKYNKLGQKVFSLNEYKSRKDVNEAIAAVNGTAVGTRTGHAMKVVRNEVFVEKNGDRADAPNVVLLVTDGRSTYPEWTFEQAQLLKDAGVRIFAIGIGGRIDADELRQTASSPDSVYVHYVNDFHGLDDILNEFVPAFCTGSARRYQHTP